MTDARPVNFQGYGFSPRGEKGRFVLPAEFRRKTVEASRGDRILCLNKHDRWPCIIGFGLAREDEFYAQIERERQSADLRQIAFDEDLRAQQLFGFRQLPFDESGRFSLPEALERLCGVEEGLYFHGAGRFFLLWSPAQLMQMGEGWESAKEYCATEMAAAATPRRARK